MFNLKVRDKFSHMIHFTYLVISWLFKYFVMRAGPFEQVLGFNLGDKHTVYFHNYFMFPF